MMYWLKWIHLCGAFYWSGSLLAAIGTLLALAAVSPRSAESPASTSAPAAPAPLVPLARAFYRRGAVPGMLLTLLGGAGMLWTTGFPPGGWMHAKLTLVLLLIVVDQIVRMKIPPTPTTSAATSPAEAAAASPNARLARALQLLLGTLIAAVLLLSVLRPF